MRWDQWHPVRSPSDSLLRSWAPVAARRRVKSLRGCQLLQCWTRWVPDLERVAIYLRCLLLPLVLGNTAQYATARRGRGGDRAPIHRAGGGLALIALKLVGCRLRLTTRRLWTVSTTSKRMLSWPSCHRNSPGGCTTTPTTSARQYR
jgi:hypothetical protein